MCFFSFYKEMYFKNVGVFFFSTLCVRSSRKLKMENRMREKCFLFHFCRCEQRSVACSFCLCYLAVFVTISFWNLRMSILRLSTTLRMVFVAFTRVYITKRNDSTFIWVLTRKNTKLPTHLHEKKEQHATVPFIFISWSASYCEIVVT